MALTPPPDQDIVVVGATGDLARRKLIPALYNLHIESLLPARGGVTGVAPFAWDDARFREFARDSVATFSRTGIDAAAFASFADRLRFVPVEGGDLGPLRAQLTEERRIVYLAVPPSAFADLIAGLGKSQLADGASLVIEKPFGRDLESARELNRTLHAVIPERRVFRIDHYLGKETVQNLLVFRFGNSMFERIWSRDAIARVEITVAENIGVEQRGKLYEEIGAIRDIVQNHMFQVLAIIAMEAPISFDPEQLRNEKVKVLQAIHPVDPRQVVRGQYRAGEVDGAKVVGYRREPGVSRSSSTETYAALRVRLDSWRWSGVHFLLRTGKRMARRDTRVVITFRDAPLHLFRGEGMHRMHSGRLEVRIQPDEGIALRFVAKQPGPELVTQMVDMDFKYGESFKTSPPEAYERLLHDALDGDHTLFIREDEVESGWAAVQRVLDHPPAIALYDAGSLGPAEADRIAAPGGWTAFDDTA
ncbi:MAG: glucose-6-phosphate dehydrogenase [Chloroflexi bacterium]|nr:MAG: glucose-6-phosphate dehydrogenase [Chloroflexota bacterium]